jgi:hypothetical protein
MTTPSENIPSLVPGQPSATNESPVVADVSSIVGNEHQQLASFATESAEFLSRDAILAKLSEVAGAPFEVTRERSDGKGVYLIDVKVGGETEGTYSEYSFRRAGKFPEHETASTDIQSAHYEDDVPVGGETLATYDAERKSW